MRKKWLRFILLAYLIPAVIGSFAFSIGENFGSANISRDKISLNHHYSAIGHSSDWLAENIATVSKALKYSSSQPWDELIREIVSIGICIAALGFGRSYLEQIKLDTIFSIKNNILLKLRI